MAEVVGDQALFDEWRGEMKLMSGRIIEVRQVLRDHLVKLNPDRNFDYIVNQIGMFAYTGMTLAQVENMTAKHHVYMTKDGRLSLAGLSAAKAPYLAAAIAECVKNA